MWLFPTMGSFWRRSMATLLGELLTPAGKLSYGELTLSRRSAQSKSAEPAGTFTPPSHSHLLRPSSQLALDSTRRGRLGALLRSLRLGRGFPSKRRITRTPKWRCWETQGLGRPDWVSSFRKSHSLQPSLPTAGRFGCSKVARLRQHPGVMRFVSLCSGTSLANPDTD